MDLNYPESTEREKHSPLTYKLALREVIGKQGSPIERAVWEVRVGRGNDVNKIYYNQQLFNSSDAGQRRKSLAALAQLLVHFNHQLTKYDNVSPEDMRLQANVIYEPPTKDDLIFFYMEFCRESEERRRLDEYHTLISPHLKPSVEGVADIVKELGQVWPGYRDT